MSEQENVEYGLIVSFPDQSHSFVHGFEAGQIEQIMTSGTVAEFDRMTHVENREVIDRMCVAYGWRIERNPTSVDGWDQCTFIKVAKAPEGPNPHGLRVVRADE